MSREKLIESLQNDADEKIVRLRKDEEAEAARIKADTETRAGLLRNEFNNRESDATKKLDSDILDEALMQSRAMRLVMESRLSERLYSLAISQLKELRGKKYDDIFTLLKNELPPLKWKTIQVCPDDMVLAQNLFPDAEIIPDNNISGGMVSATEGNRISINNTFEKRLENIWNDIAPQIIKAVYQEARGNGTDSGPST